MTARLGAWAARGGRALLAVLPQWLVARVVVLGALAMAHLLVTRTHPTGAGVAARVHQGLLGWDAGWYEAIARFGYGPLGHQSLRFFPLLPLVARLVAYAPGVHAGAAVVILANAGALVGTALLRVLVLRETGDRDLAARSVWLLSVAPPAFVLVMGYAEGPLLLCTVGCLLALRRGSGRGRWAGPAFPNWWVAVALGLAAGLVRPLGVLLAFPAAVEAVRWWRRSPPGRRVASLAAVAAAPVGAAVFLAWSWIAFSNPLLPVRVQTQAGHHGGLSDPIQTLVDDAKGVLHHHFGTALHVPWVILAVILLVVCWRRLPAAYGAFATAVVAVSLSGTNLDSFERYALSAFPLVVAAATLLGDRRWERSILIMAGAGMFAYALLAFMNISVP